MTSSKIKNRWVSGLRTRKLIRTGMRVRATGWPLFLAFLASGSRIFGSSRERKGRVTSKRERKKEEREKEGKREGEEEKEGKTSPAPKTGRRDLWSGWEFLLPLTLLCYATASLHPCAGCFFFSLLYSLTSQLPSIGSDFQSLAHSLHFFLLAYKSNCYLYCYCYCTVGTTVAAVATAAAPTAAAAVAVVVVVATTSNRSLLVTCLFLLHFKFTLQGNQSEGRKN